MKQRAGCLSYMEDKLGYHSELARTLTQSECVPWDPPAKAIISFTSESTLRNFCDNYLTPGHRIGCHEEERLQQVLTRVTYDLVVKDKLVAIPIFAALFKVACLYMRTKPFIIQFFHFSGGERLNCCT